MGGGKGEREKARARAYKERKRQEKSARAIVQRDHERSGLEKQKDREKGETERKRDSARAHTRQIEKNPPKWQENELVSGGHGRAAKLGACVNRVDWLRTSADKQMWSGRRAVVMVR